MIKARCGIAVCGFLLAVASGVFAEEEHFLGFFKGGVIPGYHIVEMQMVASEISGLQRQNISQEALQTMRTTCAKKNGVALVNVTLALSIGNVRVQTPTGQFNTVSPGIYISGLADCVLKVEKTTQ